jgi:glucose-6-phosphate dehydrogenase assembly protein OpcA
VTVADPNNSDLTLQAWVSIHCQMPPSGGKQVCAEQIYVSAGGEAVRQIPAAVIPLLLSELPVFLWWPQGSPFDEYLFRQLADSITRLIIDSAAFENVEGTLAKMATRVKSDWPTMAFSDMNWGRLTRWREMVAQFFDGATLRPYLDRVDRVTIDFALSRQGAPANRAQALLIAGWLASRLGWQPVDPVHELVRSSADQARPAATRLTLQSGDRPITILLQPSEQTSDVPGEIQKIKLEVAEGDPKAPPEAMFEVCISEEDQEGTYTNVEISGIDPYRRNFTLELPDRPMLLDAELEIFSSDRIYEEALAMVGLYIRGTSAGKESEGPRKTSTGEPVSSGAYRVKQQGQGAKPK